VEANGKTDKEDFMAILDAKREKADADWKAWREKADADRKACQEEMAA
jgi:hypothetical protein